MRTDQEMPPETRRNHVGSSIIEGPWPAVTSGFLVGETPELQLGTSMLRSVLLAEMSTWNPLDTTASRVSIYGWTNPELQLGTSTLPNIEFVRLLLSPSKRAV